MMAGYAQRFGHYDHDFAKSAVSKLNKERTRLIQQYEASRREPPAAPGDTVGREKM